MAQIRLECDNAMGGVCMEYTGTLTNTSSTPLFITGDLTIQQTTTTPAIINGFTHGEIINSLFLFMIFMVGIFSLFWFGIIKPHVHRIHKK